MNENIFISLDIIKENDIEYFLSYGKFYLHETIKKTFKQKKNINISIFFTIKKEYRKFLLTEINKFRKLKLDVKINLSQNEVKKDYLNTLQYYKKNNYNIFIKITGDSIIDEDFILRILKYFNIGYSSIFTNLIEVYEDDFKKYFKNIKFRKFQAEKFLFNFLSKNTHLYNFKEINLIKKKKFIILESIFPKLLAFSKNKNNKPIFLNNFQDVGQIILKSYLDEGFKTRYLITEKIVSEINKNILPNLDKTKNNYRLYIRKIPLKKNSNKLNNTNDNNKFLKINNENILNNIVTNKDKDIDFMYYKSLYIYHVYRVYKKKFKIPLFLILLLSFVPFPIRKFIYFFILKKIYFKSDPFYDHTIDRLLFHQSKNNLIFFLNNYFKKK